MNSVILASIIQAVAVIFATIISVWAGRNSPGGNLSRIRTIIVILFPIIGVGIFLFGTYYVWLQIGPSFMDFAPPFSFSRLEYLSSNAQLEASNEKETLTIPELPLYELNSNNIKLSNNKYHPQKVNGYIYYRSNLQDHNSSYTIVAFTRFASADFSKDHGLIVAIYSNEPDMLELALKDSHNFESKPLLPVIKGWACYKIPFSEFPIVDMNKIARFHIAHSIHNNSKNFNIFKIALIDLY